MDAKNVSEREASSSLFRKFLLLGRWAMRLICTIVIVFLLIELMVIVVEHFTSPQPATTATEEDTGDMTKFWTEGRGHRDPVPYIMFYTEPNLDAQDRYFGRQRAHLVTNNYGFRYTENIKPEKQPNEFRIFMLGGSVVFNGKTNETTITGMLETRLNNARGGEKHYRCINAGVSSFISDQELALLVHRIVDLNPDLVIVFDGFNDLWFPFYYEPRVGYPINWGAYENAFQNNTHIKHVMRSIDFFDGIISTSRLITRFRPDLTLENRVTHSFYEEITKEHPTPTITEIVDHLQKNWNKMYQFAKTSGIPVICILQPGNPKIRDKDFVAEFYAKMNTYIEKQHKDSARPYFSFDRLLDDKPDLFVPGDPVHTWDDGHSVYVAEMLKILKETNVLP